MKIAASITSWIGGLISAAFLLFKVSIFIQTDVEYRISHYLYEYQNNPSKALFDSPYLIILILAVIGAILIIWILIWREFSVAGGYKIACGICTLIFASVLGGILTLCIPQSQLEKKKSILPW